MKKQRIAFILSVILCAILLSTHHVYASDDEPKNSKEEAVSSNRNEREQLRGSATDIQEIRDNLQADKDDLELYVVELDSAMAKIQLRIDELNKQLADKRKEIGKTEEELREAEHIRSEQYERAKAHIQYMFERPNLTYFDILVKSESFSDLVNQSFLYQMLFDYDNERLQEYQNATDLVNDTKELLEEEYMTLQAFVDILEEERRNISLLIDDKTEQIVSISEEIFSKNVEIDAYNDAISMIEKEIASLQESLAGKYIYDGYDGGDFIWPCPEYTHISSDFGYRTGTYSGFHGGVDMAANAGMPILAAYEGVVKSCGYSGSMGNYVWISHGDGLETIYMHGTKIYVTQGQYVSTGEHIADVGSTGWSTGPHLHFQVMENNTAVTPWDYLQDPRRR